MGIEMNIKMNLKILLASMMFVVGCATAPSDAIKVASYNIRLSGENGRADRGTPNAWKERKEDLLALVQKLDLDVFGLQEVCPDQAQFLRENLVGYEFVGEHRNADRKSGEASPVCYRKSRFEALGKGTFWLSETPDTPGLKGWGAACPRVCSYLILRDISTGKKFCFANVHTDHVSALARMNGMLLVIDRMKKFGAGLPIVFTGDHNCREMESPAMVVKEHLKDALYISESEQKGSWRTFSGWKWMDQETTIKEALQVTPELRNAKKGSPDAMKDADGQHPYEKYGARIDYIYVSDGIRVMDFKTVNDPRPGEKLYPSDHFPVVATIEL
jgi:endonuclease/exonuclease/phosphatase family metal-dependent hydrolase